MDVGLPTRPTSGYLWGESNEVENLVPNLRNKTKYVLHYRNLQLYLFLGMKLVKIHRVLRFDQSPWVASYIHKNTELCKRATYDFEKDLFKLLNNLVFGKTMENLRKRQGVKLVRSCEENRLRKLIADLALSSTTDSPHSTRTRKESC